MSHYRGRFAPSPTGPLHIGSLFAALISYLEARYHSGTWLLRIEDIDPQREQAGATQSIIDTLKAHHLIWDEEICFQSTRSALYEKTLKHLADNHHTFLCPCSRKQLSARNNQHLDTCIQQTPANRFTQCATKFRIGNAVFSWHDGVLGEMNAACHEDFVLKRKEGFYAYQLAVVCDDIEQKITHVVRGSDLLESTPMQLALYQALDVAPPEFSHFPVLLNEHNQKLSKQTFARAVDPSTPLANLRSLFSLLKLPLTYAPRSPKEALEMALDVWNTDYIPNAKTLKQTLSF